MNVLIFQEKICKTKSNLINANANTDANADADVMIPMPRSSNRNSIAILST